eukprot:768822-Hanusia_phi.AAC.6
MEHNVRGKGMGGEGERGGWRAKHELRDKSDDENSWPRGNAYTSGEEISDIDARLNALQSFLQVSAPSLSTLSSLPLSSLPLLPPSPPSLPPSPPSLPLSLPLPSLWLPKTRRSKRRTRAESAAEEEGGEEGGEQQQTASQVHAKSIDVNVMIISTGLHHLLYLHILLLLYLVLVLLYLLLVLLLVSLLCGLYRRFFPPTILRPIHGLIVLALNVRGAEEAGGDEERRAEESRGEQRRAEESRGEEMKRGEERRGEERRGEERRGEERRGEERRGEERRDLLLRLQQLLLYV